MSVSGAASLEYSEGNSKEITLWGNPLLGDPRLGLFSVGNTQAQASPVLHVGHHRQANDVRSTSLPSLTSASVTKMM